MNAIVKAEPQHTSNGLIPRNMGEAMQLAEMMARGKMMPEHLRNPGDALMVIEQAMRWNMSPFAVAQATFNIKGKLLFAGTIVAAAIEDSGAIQGLMDYQFSGEGQNRKVTVSATRRGESTPRTVEVVLKDAATENGIWKKQPDQQLVYHGSRVWARRWTPGVMLGVYTPEEWHQQRDTFAGTTLEAEPEAQAPAAPAAPPKRTIATWLAELRTRLDAAPDVEAVVAIAASEEVVRALDKLKNGALEELNALLADAHARLAETPHDPETGEVEAEFPGDR
jgi:hypothetical protein